MHEIDFDDSTDDYKNNDETLRICTVSLKDLWKIRKISCNFFWDSERAHQDEHFAIR